MSPRDLLMWTEFHLRASLYALSLRWKLDREEPLLPVRRVAAAMPCPDPAAVRLALTAAGRAVRLLCTLNTCLTRSLVAYRLLSRHQGVGIHFGFRRASSRMLGHAWLSVGGEPAGESSDPRAIYVETSEMFVLPAVFNGD